ncbi:MAG: HEPN domain-containing protein [Planctomycetota bacterium]
MSSNSYGTFQYNLVDVDRLVESHAALSGTGLGRRGLGHITRSGVVMLCAAWEMYTEQVLLEGLDFLVNRVASPDQLPKSVQKKLSSYVREHKNELKPLHLAGDGWKTILIEYATSKTNALNTPKSGNLNELYNSFIGIDQISDSWSRTATFVDTFVGVRGDIAHRGRHADYITIPQLSDYRDGICLCVKETDNAISQHIKAVSPARRKPWNSIT